MRNVPDNEYAAIQISEIVAVRMLFGEFFPMLFDKCSATLPAGVCGGSELWKRRGLRPLGKCRGISHFPHSSGCCWLGCKITVRKMGAGHQNAG